VTLGAAAVGVAVDSTDCAKQRVGTKAKHRA
jgi:hypothetical protein